MPKQQRKEGRPRSEHARRAILRSTNRLLERMTVRDLTIEGIAKSARVGKPTIYRWWPNKVAVVIDAFFETLSAQLEYPQADTVAASLRKQLHRALKMDRSREGRLIAEILAEGQFDPDILRTFRTRFLDFRRAAATALIRDGQQRGEISPDLDADLAIDLIYGPIYYRLLVGHLPLEDRLADDIVDWIFSGFSPRPSETIQPLKTAANGDRRERRRRNDAQRAASDGG